MDRFFRVRPRRPGVSVVIPVYNAGAYLAPCLDSVLAQDLPPRELEVVAVDDGSTDGSGELLDVYAARHPQVRVLHQENSGWPGRPRNVGLAASTGTFVYFVDADDYLAPEALRRMWQFATRHGSDVLVPRIRGVGGRRFSGRPWRTTQVDADLTRAFLTISPMKMFRRSFLDRQGLRFLEGKVRLEDGIFMAEAYLTASRVSILGGYKYYFQRRRADRGNISRQRPDPDSYAASVARMLELIDEHGRAPRHPLGLAEELTLLVYRRKGLRWFASPRFERYDEDYRRAWVAAMQGVAQRLVPEPLDDRLPFPQRVRSRLVRRGDQDALLAFVKASRGRAKPVVNVRDGRVLMPLPGLPDHEPLDLTRDAEPAGRVRRLTAAEGGFRLELSVRLRGLTADSPPDVAVVLSRRGAGDERALSVRVVREQSPGRYLLDVAVGECHLRGPLPARWDLRLRRQVPAPDGGPALVLDRRLKGPEVLRSAAPVLTGGDRRIWPVLTTAGHVSFRVASTAASVADERRAASARELLAAGAVWAAIGRASRRSRARGTVRELARRVRRRIGA